MAGGVESMLAGVIVSELGATAAVRGCGKGIKHNGLRGKEGTGLIIALMFYFTLSKPCHPHTALLNSLIVYAIVYPN